MPYHLAQLRPLMNNAPLLQNPHISNPMVILNLAVGGGRVDERSAIGLNQQAVVSFLGRV